MHITSALNSLHWSNSAHNSKVANIYYSLPFIPNQSTWGILLTWSTQVKLSFFYHICLSLSLFRSTHPSLNSPIVPSGIPPLVCGNLFHMIASTQHHSASSNSILKNISPFCIIAHHPTPFHTLPHHPAPFRKSNPPFWVIQHQNHPTPQRHSAPSHFIQYSSTRLCNVKHN